MKKVLSIILALSMLGSLLAVGVSAEETAAAPVFTDISGLPCEEAVNTLAQRGIVNGRSEGIYAPNEGLTRAEMTAIILRAFGSKEIEDIEKFKDVPPTHWAYMYVETAYKMGIINGMTATTFVPEGSVTYEQAVKMLVCAAGKGNKAEKEGGWPDGYIKTATDMGALDGIDGQRGQAISRGTMAQMVHNFVKISEDKLSILYDWENEPLADHYDWIKKDRVRGIYGGILEIFPENNTFERAAAVGANAFFLNTTAPGYAYKTMEGRCEVIDDAAKHFHRYEGVKMFVKIGYGDGQLAENDEFGIYHPGTPATNFAILPCPLIYEYWKKEIEDFCVEVAKRKEWAGAIIDFEMHAGGLSKYTGTCKCDKCWSKFAEAMGRDDWKDIATEERGAFIKTNPQLQQQNDTWFRNEVIKIVSRVREAVHAVNPEFIFGNMPGYDTIPGITKGFGTPERPMLVLSESEYWGMYATIEPKLQSIKDREEDALLICGLWTQEKQALKPDEFEAGITAVSTMTGGYWVYNAAGYARNLEENSAGMERSNKILDEDLAAGTIREIPQYEYPEYTAKKIAGDVPTEAEWEAAPFTDDFTYIRRTEDPDGIPDVLTKAKILYSNNDLFVRTYCYDDMAAFKVPQPQPERDTGLWADQCVEIYWMFEDETTIAQCVGNAAGSIYDAYSHAIGQRDKTYTFNGLEFSTELKEDRWELTARMPGNPIGVRKIEKGDVLKMQISRYHPASIIYGDNALNQPWVRTNGGYLGTAPISATVYLD